MKASLTKNSSFFFITDKNDFNRSTVNLSVGSSTSCRGLVSRIANTSTTGLKCSRLSILNALVNYVEQAFAIMSRV